MWRACVGVIVTVILVVLSGVGFVRFGVAVVRMQSCCVCENDLTRHFFCSAALVVASGTSRFALYWWQLVMRRTG